MPTTLRRLLHLLTVAVLALSIPSPSTSQGAPGSDRWAAVRFLVGSWEGTSQGQPGKAVVRREYRFVLRDQFLEGRSSSTYPPQPSNEKGEEHEDVGLFSYDRGRKALVLRQFHVEGFVNQYREDQPAAAGALSLTSEAIENIPPGWRARESYVVVGPDEFEDTFELAEPGKPFEVYSRARLKRTK